MYVASRSEGNAAGADLLLVVLTASVDPAIRRVLCDEGCREVV